MQDTAPFCTCWLYDDSASAYTDGSSEVRKFSGGSYTWVGQTADCGYIGFSRKFKTLVIDVSTAGSYTSVAWKYNSTSSNLTWTSLVPIIDYTFSGSSYLIFNLPEDWCKTNFDVVGPHPGFTPPDNTARYWLQVSVSGVTTPAVISKISVVPNNSYTTASEVNAYLQFKAAFDSATIPTDDQVSDWICEAEDFIDWKTHKSWRWNLSSSPDDSGQSESNYEFYDYNHYGIKLNNQDIIRVYNLDLWDGSAWQALTLGRNEDYFAQRDIGFIFISRLFIPPIAYGLPGRFYNWEYGEYKKSFRIRYSYGKDWRTARNFNMVKNIANMMVASKVITNCDYSKMVTRGTDSVPFQAKIEIWDRKIEEGLENLTGFLML